MTTAVTFKSLIEETLEQTNLGLVLGGSSYSANTTTITQTNSTLTGFYNQQRIPRGCPILLTAGGGVGENTASNLYTPSAGTITVSPSVTTGSTAAVLAYYDSGIDHFDRVKEAINRAHQNRAVRRQMMPLTYVPDGDLQGATVTDYWTAAANGTAAYANAQTFPAGSAADAVGTVGLNRVVQLTTSGGGSSLAGNGMRTVLSTRQQSWYFQTAIRLVSGTGTAAFKIVDNTNSADITLQVTRGNDTNTLTTTSLGGFMVCEGTFQVPATCAEVAPQLTLSATGLVAQMGPVIMFPLDAVSFPLPDRLMSAEDVGNLRYATTLVGPGGYSSMAFSEPITSGGLTHSIRDYGDHMTLELNFLPRRAIWWEEHAYGAALTAMTDTTTFPLETVVRWSAFELYKWLAKKDKKKYQQNAIEAQKATRGYGQPEMINVVGRVA